MSCRDHRLTVCDVGSADGKMFHCVLIADSFMVHECDLGYIHTRAVCVLYIRGVLPIASNMRPNFFLSFCNIFLIKTGNFFGWFMVFMHHLLHFVAFCCLFSIRYRSQQPININESAFNMQKKNFSCECQVPWVGVRSHLKIHWQDTVGHYAKFSTSHFAPFIPYITGLFQTLQFLASYDRPILFSRLSTTI